MLTLRLFDQKQSVSTTIREDFDILVQQKEGNGGTRPFIPHPQLLLPQKKKKEQSKTTCVQPVDLFFHPTPIHAVG